MISGGNATVYVSDLDAAIRFYTERLGLTLTNRFGRRWATVQTGPSYWTTDEVGAGLTIGLHPHSDEYLTRRRDDAKSVVPESADHRSPAPGTAGGVGFGLETYEPIETVSARLTERGVRVDADIVTFEAGKVVSLVDQDGLPTFVWEMSPEMLADIADGGDDQPDGDAAADMIAGGHAIVYVRNMDDAVRFYTQTLGLALTYRFEDNIAFVEAGRLVIALHPRTPRTPEPGAKGSVMLGLTIDEPIERVVSQLTARGVRITGPIVRAEGNFVEFEDPDGNPLYLWEEVKQEVSHDDERATVATITVPSRGRS